MNTKNEGPFIHFQKLNKPLGRKTDIWNVDPLQAGGFTLGQVKWFGAWRRYAFFPSAGTVFEETCLRQIANFCQHETYVYKESRPNLRVVPNTSTSEFFERFARTDDVDSNQQRTPDETPPSLPPTG